jgi:hypothetical protein
VADSDTVSLALTGVFGVVSSLGVLYQIVDIRQRSRASTTAGAGPVSAVAVPPVAAPPVAGPVGWPPPEPPTTHLAPYSGPPVSPTYPVYPQPPPGSFTVPAPPPSAYAPSAYYPPPVPPQPGPLYGPPPIPRSVLRARLLLLLVSVFTAASVALLIYVSQVEIADAPGSQTSLPMTVVAGAILILIVATPLSLIPMAMSLLIGRAREWARITSIVVLFSQGLCCSCFGAFIPFSPAYSGSDASGEKAVVGDAVLGALGVLIGVASVAVAILLLTKGSSEYFRAMARWRAARPGLPPQ